MTVWHLYIPIVFFLSAVTWDRFNHFAWATAFFIVSLIIFAGIKKIRGNKSILIRYWLQASRPSNVSKTHGFIMSLFVLYLGSWLPDSDWLIYSHRNPLTHSILPFLFMTWLIDKWKFGNHDWNKLLLIMFGYGLGSHLLTDIIPGGNVVWLPAYIDMPFLFINGLSCIIISHRSISKRLKMDHDFNKSMEPNTEG